MKQYIVPIILVVAILATTTGYLLAREKYSGLDQLRGLSQDISQSEYRVANTPAQSFGALGQLSNAQPKTAQEMLTADSTRELVANGGGALGSSEPGTDSGLSIAPYNPIVYRFNYQGEDFTNLLKSQQPVFKRDRLRMDESNLASVVAQYSFGLINFSRLSTVQLQNIGITEDPNQGYSAYIDAINQSISMYRNGEVGIAEDGRTMIAQPAPSSSTPVEVNEREAIEAANNFLAGFNVSLSGYAAPQIENNWPVFYGDGPSDSPLRYVPPTLEIVYPYLIDGLQSYEESGSFAGLRVSYNTYTKQIQALNDLRVRQYQRSEYPGVTDAERIIDIAERGGFRSYSYEEPNARRVTLNLDTPEVKVMRLWRYSNSSYVGEEIFVPVLVFPITNRGDYWRSNVMVPLVAEVLDNDDFNPQPIPLDSPVSDAPASIQVQSANRDR